jgi:plastocyanin
MEKLTSIQQLNHSIMFGSWTNTELTSMLDAVKWNRAQLAQATKRQLQVGDTVKFTSNRDGRTHTGTVDKIKIKYVLVKTPAGRYNVPANMLEAA